MLERERVLHRVHMVSYYICVCLIRKLCVKCIVGLALIFLSFAHLLSTILDRSAPNLSEIILHDVLKQPCTSP